MLVIFESGRGVMVDLNQGKVSEGVPFEGCRMCCFDKCTESSFM